MAHPHGRHPTRWLPLATLALALGSSVPILLAWWRRPQRRPVVPPATWPTLTVLRPCEGASPGLAAALESSWTCAYPGPREVLICTASPADPAAAVGAAMLAAPGRTGRVVVDQVAHAGWQNPKVRHLQAGFAAAQGEIVLQADADVVLSATIVTELVALLHTPGTSAVFAPPTVHAAPAWGSQVIRTYMTGSLHAFPLLLGLTRALGAPPALSGALVAFWRSALPDGYAAAAQVIGDDLVLGTTLAAHGQVLMGATPVVCEQQALRLATARVLLARWVYVAGVHGPARLLGYPLLFAATPLLLLMLAALARQHRTPLRRLAMLVGMGSVGLRLAVAQGMETQLHGTRWTWRQPGRLLVTELCLLEAAGRAALRLLRRQPLRWRARCYTIGRGGTIRQVTEEPAPAPGRHA